MTRTLALATLGLALAASLAAPVAEAHFHEGLLVTRMDVHVRQLAPGEARVEATLRVTNPGPEPYTRAVYAPFPASAVERGLAAGEAGALLPVAEEGALTTAPVPGTTQANYSLPPGGALVVRLAYTVRGDPAASTLVAPVLTLYRTENLTLSAEPASGYAASAAGARLGEATTVPVGDDAALVQSVEVVFTQEGLPKLVWLGIAAALLVAGAWLLDRRAKRHGHDHHHSHAPARPRDKDQSK